MSKKYILSKSTRKGKKYMIVTPENKTIHFGAKGYSDYTKHKDPKRKQRYIARHRINQNWAISGINTAGWWSKWLLWNEPTLTDSIRKTEKIFKIKIIRR